MWDGDMGIGMGWDGAGRLGWDGMVDGGWWMGLGGKMETRVLADCVSRQGRWAEGLRHFPRPARSTPNHTEK